jgi:hypothetical protein
MHSMHCCTECAAWPLVHGGYATARLQFCLRAHARAASLSLLHTAG